ncbi:TPA: 4'-phosphopantetheinyl transferase superfamily protein [Pseudomonas aeruginosa]|nr:4'-phosphopantetheinyl transferase superfamily protein [Pseudomonas aeruginosa]HEO1551662.1 4'-phosphopantetheinyl transferase superfamily protein [Pseudomonas aeruginosa]
MTAWIPGLADLLELSPDIRLSGLALPTGRTAMNVLGLAAASWPGLSMVTDMSHKRRREFLAGRLCALHSLLEMGVDAEFPLPAQDRMPIWPPGILGSISHCASVAVAMAAPASRFHALGIDVETLIDAEIAQDIRHSVGRDRELECLERSIPCCARSLTLLFSAKEALYKALYPFSRQYKDFHAAEIISCQAKALVLRLTEDWCGSWRGGACVEVRYTWLDREVLTAVCIPRTSPIHSRTAVAAVTEPEV